MNNIRHPLLTSRPMQVMRMAALLAPVLAPLAACTTPTPTDRAHAPLAYNLNMVHHNPGEAPFNTPYTDPAFLKAHGFNGYVPRVFMPCTITYDAFDPALMPPGSKLRLQTEAYAKIVDEHLRKAKAAGIPMYPFTDLLVVPQVLQAKYGKEMVALTDKEYAGGEHANPVLGGHQLRASILRPRTREILKAQLDGIFTRFPDLDGLTVRFGETYLHEFPDYAGGSPIADAQGQIALVKLLREEVCVKRNKKVFFRTWDFGNSYNPAFYLQVTNAVEPHPNLCFSIKNVAKDFLRMQTFHPCLGIGNHQQIVEISCNPAGIGGKNAHPYYIGKGVIDGWEETAWLKHEGPAGNLRDMLKRPQFAGIWTWARGDGWGGPYTPNEMWVDINEFVFSGFAQAPWKSEKTLFEEAVKQRCRINGEDLNKMRRLCLLSADAMVRGERSLVMDTDGWWCRDHYLTAIDLTPVVEAHKTKEVLAEKAEGLKMWSEIEKLAHEIHLPDPADQKFLEVSCAYGRLKYSVMAEIWKMQLLVAEAKVDNQPLDLKAMAAAISAYDRFFAEWRALRASNPESCATLYQDDVTQFTQTPAFGPVLAGYRQRVAKSE